MKPFDEKATCPKCGGQGVGTDYCEGYGDGWMPSGRPEVERERGEHLRRTCNRCHFRWNEACIKEVSELVLCQKCGTAAVGCCECGDDYADGGNEMSDDPRKDPDAATRYDAAEVR